MPRKLDANRIEEARSAKRETVPKSPSIQEDIRETIARNRRGERRVTVLEPSKKTGISGETKKMRVAAYCRVSTQEDAQANSFEMQKQHFKDVIEGNPMYEMVDIYADDGISGTSINKRKEFLRMLDDARRGKIEISPSIWIQTHYSETRLNPLEIRYFAISA